MIGKSILHYDILSKLGEGGMGIVYKARDTKLDREVAIKFLPADVAQGTDERARFIVEAKAAASLNHANIATIYAIEESDDRLFIAMEYVDGQELRRLVRTSPPAPPLPVDTVIDYAIQIAKGLEAAHKKGIVHRDVKSANIMITSDGGIKIMDFGLAKVGGRTHLTRTGTTMGTVAYMSPEQARGGEVDQRSDIWSFGVVLYEMVTGTLPFVADHEQAVLYLIMNDDPSPLGARRADAPQALEALVKKALAKDRGGRYAHMGDVIDDLNALRHDVSSGAPTVRTAAMAVNKDVPPRLAVLPFSSMKSDPDTDYLGFALADQIITALSYVRNVIVRPSSAIRQYANKDIDAALVGRELQVDHMLTGYYLKEADMVRLTVEVVRTDSNEMVWRKPIEVKYENAFRLQDMVSKEVIRGLEVQFSKDESGRIEGDVPEDPLAYEYYLRAVSYPRSNEGDRLAIGMLRKAIRLDGRYAPAHAQLGYRLASYGTYSLQGADAYKGAEEAYLTALSLNDDLLAALDGLGRLYTDIGKTDKALDYARRMLRINPNHALAHHTLSYVLRYVGMLDESIAEGEKALALDPKNPVFRTLGYAYFYRGDYEKAIEMFGLDKGSVMEISWRGFSLFLMGQQAEGMALIEEAVQLEPEGHFGQHLGAIKAAVDGNRELAMENTRRWEATHPYDSEVWYNIANTYAFIGDQKGCVRALKRTINGGFFCYTYMIQDPLLEPMRDDPEVAQLLAQAKAKHDAFKARYARGSRS